jgi:hypothetical protein
MAPSTRLRDQPERRVDYAANARVGSRANPIDLEDTPPPAPRIQNARQSTGALAPRASAPPIPAAAPRTRGARASQTARKSERSNITRVDAGAVVKLKAPVKKAATVKALPSAKKLPPPKRECSVCASTKSVSHSFRLDKNDETCEHFKGICGQCIAKMIAGKIESRQLSEAELTCPYPDCDHVLDHADLKAAFMNKEKFKEYDAALAKHFLAANPDFIACLSSKCGKYFSIQDCSRKDNDGKTSTENSKAKIGSKSTGSGSNHSTKPQQIACPYCDSTLCLTCNRPWHAGKLCSAAAALEDESSVARIKALGAKPCPKCGINIEKQGGCDHMTCHRCRHNFCWQCLVPFNATVAHLEGCPHSRRDVAVDPRNWVPENMTVEQVNQMIEQARQRMDNPEPQQQDEQQMQGGPPQFVGGALVPNQGMFANALNALFGLQGWNGGP